MSNGACQQLPLEFVTTWFPFMKLSREKIVLADHFLRKWKYKETMKMIN